jgi:hypothetical protein
VPLATFFDRRLRKGKLLVVRNGYKPEQELLISTGPLEAQQSPPATMQFSGLIRHNRKSFHTGDFR